jgi:hypothetical protein
MSLNKACVLRKYYLEVTNNKEEYRLISSIFVTLSTIEIHTRMCSG